MKVRIIELSKGRDFKVGDILEFNTPVELTYARSYIDNGWAVAIDEAAERAQAEADRLAAKRAAVVIPANYADLLPAEARALAAELTDEPVKSKDEAFAIIAAEFARRTPAAS